MTRIQELVDVARGRWLGVRLVDDECRCRFELPIGRPQSVLVIDDNEGVAKVFGAFLEDSGYQVIGCTSGDDALRSAADLRPIAITLDIMMPNQDGWEILQTLKADRTTSEIPIIVCSVLEDPALAKSLGADAYLRKPVAEAELRATLQELV